LDKQLAEYRFQSGQYSSVSENRNLESKVTPEEEMKKVFIKVSKLMDKEYLNKYRSTVTDRKLNSTGNLMDQT